MAIEWIKSLHCKSKDDVLQVQQPRNGIHRHSSVSSTPTTTSTSTSSSCKSTVHQSTSTRFNPDDPIPPRPSSKRRLSAKSKSQPSTRFTAAAKTLCPSLTELPLGHPSRNVVEIIFRSGWGANDFPVQVEMVFKVHNLTRTVARFEEYREHVKSRARAGEDHARSVADGNELMRFYCLGGAYETGGWGLHSGKEAAVCTYSGSGAAHENAGGGGRRAMLVCRVIAGRVCRGVGSGTRVGYESRSTETGELYVFDTRAVLPCFLIIYHKPH